jgi:hypothetical protein
MIGYFNIWMRGLPRFWSRDHVSNKMAITTLRRGSGLTPDSVFNEHIGCGMEESGQGETSGLQAMFS